MNVGCKPVWTRIIIPSGEFTIDPLFMVQSVDTSMVTVQRLSNLLRLRALLLI
jgi:hypothetical protein